MTAQIEAILDDSEEPVVRGFLHKPESSSGDGLVLSHGAGSNAQSPLLIDVASAFAERRITVLRIDLPFRQSRPHGPPFPATAARDQQGIRRAAELMKSSCSGRLFLGGHSYGGRQTTMLVAQQPELAVDLVLFSYPLHPPRRPEQKRDAHFPKLQTPALFLHGSRDPFGSPEEMREALKLIPARTELVIREGAGHELGKGVSLRGLAQEVVERFMAFVGSDS